MTMLVFTAIFSVLVALASADTFVPQFNRQFLAVPQFQQRSVVQAPVLSRTEDRKDNGQYNYNYQTSDGQAFQESGVPKRNLENDGDVIVKKGTYQFTSPEGIQYSLSYTADETGFHPVGSHLPTPVQAPGPVRF